MKTSPHNQSIKNILSVTITAFSLVVLVSLSTIVYLAIHNHLQIKQNSLLIEKQNLLAHIIEEGSNKDGLSAIQHRLDDFFVGHKELDLLIEGINGENLYSSSEPLRLKENYESVEYSMQATSAIPTLSRAILFYDSANDRELLARLAMTLFGVTLFGAVTIAAVSRVLITRGMRPVMHLAQKISSMDMNTGLYKLDSASQPEELRTLVIQFNDLVDRLNRSYVQLENFNADVAHELNTPLTTLIISNELALQEEFQRNVYKDHIGSNLEELHRISSIIRDMLFVARSERGESARRNRVESIAELAKEVFEYHQDDLESRNITPLVEGDMAGHFDASLIKRALSNLVGNASRYARKNTAVIVNLGADGPYVRIGVSNIGVVLPVDQMDRVFDRFYRGNNARNDSMTHHGLGLSIVASIARMHLGDTFVQSKSGVNTFGFRCLIQKSEECKSVSVV